MAQTTFPVYGALKGPSGWIVQLQAYVDERDSVSDAVPDDFYQDGVATAASTTFTSATANFVAGDVGKTIVIEKARTSETAFHTTIASRTNATTVVLTNAPLRSQSSARFYISRAGDQSVVVQAEIDAMSITGGGTLGLYGVGYLLANGLVLKNRVWIRGASERGTLLHMGINSNQIAVVRNDYVTDNSAAFCGVLDLTVDGNQDRNQDYATTVATTAYTAGNNTVSLASGAGAQVLARVGPAGTCLIGTNRLIFTGVSGDTLTGVIGGIDDTVDANASIGAAVTFVGGHGVYFVPQPYNAIPVNSEHYDPHHLVQNVFARSNRGDGFSIWGQSEVRLQNCYAANNENVGIRPAFDTWLDNCAANANGRMGYYIRGSSTQGNNLKSFANGGNEPGKGYGYLIEGPSSLETGCTSLVGLNAQDNRADGIVIRNAQRRIISGTCDSNGQNSTDIVGTGTFTVDTTNDTILKTAHGLQVDQTIMFTSSGTIPAGLVAGTLYYVIVGSGGGAFSANQFQVSLTKGGVKVDITSTGTGTHKFAGGTYVGVKFVGVSSLNIVDVVCTERNAAPNNGQQNAFYIESGCLNNAVRISHGPMTGVVVGDALHPGSDLSGGNMLVVNAAQIAAKNLQTVSYTLVAADADRIIEMNSASALNLTIPPNSSVAFPIGTMVEIFQYGVGQVTVVPGAGVTLVSPSAKRKLAIQYASASLRKRAINEWTLEGDIVP